jgi:hypothetical chaperone protein
MYLGIDFGTSNTAAAIIDESGKLSVLPLDASLSDSRVLRTMLYVERDGDIHVGSQAVSQYRKQNVGRSPRFSKVYIGTIDIELGELLAKGYDLKGGAVLVDVFSDVDADAPGRLLHALKSPLATDYEGTKLFGNDYSLEALIAEFLSRARVRIVELTGRDVKHAVLGRPVNFASATNEADNERAQSRLEQAAKLAGFDEIVFEREPIAASLAFGLQHTIKENAHIFVFDFGGGTLDVAVVRLDKGAQTVLATGGVGIAGDHFDQTLFKRALLKWFGSEVKWGAQRLDFPSHILSALGDWQDIALLSNAKTLGFIREAQKNCDDPIRLLALEDLIAKGHGYDVYARVEEAKTNLSNERFVTIAYEAGAISIWQPITRAQFESFIAQERRAIESMIRDTLQRADIRAEQIEYVVRTGGSSAIPCFIDLLTWIFGREKIVEQDLFTGVASGLAVKARELGMKNMMSR